MWDSVYIWCASFPDLTICFMDIKLTGTQGLKMRMVIRIALATQNRKRSAETKIVTKLIYSC